MEIQEMIDESVAYTNIYDLLMNAQHSGFMHERLKKSQEFLLEKHAKLKIDLEKHPDQELVKKVLGDTLKEII